MANISIPNNKQQTLFSFVSLRSPERYKEKNKEQRFVFCNNLEKVNKKADENVLRKTFYYKELAKSKSKKGHTNVWNQMFDISGFFDKKLHDIRNENIISRDFLNLAIWLGNNKSNHRVEDLHSEFLKERKNVETLLPQKEAVLWDNLFYQILFAEDFYLKEDLMDMLILQNTLKYDKHYSTIESKKATALHIKKFENLINANVVLPVELFQEGKYIFGQRINSSIGTIHNDPTISESLRKKHLVSVAKSQINNLSNERAKLKALLDDNDNNSDNKDAIEQKIKTIDEKLGKQNLTVIDNTNFSKSIVVFGGEEICIKGDDNSLAFVGTFNIDSSNGHLQIDFQDNSFSDQFYPITAQVKMKSSDSKDEYNSNFKYEYSNAKYLNSELQFSFPDISINKESIEFIVTVELNFNNYEKRILSFVLRKYAVGNTYTGTGEIWLIQNESEELEHNFIPKGFGYKNIGLADYRKVVQEICCYEAAEVSHIENIMQGEVKEKITTSEHISEMTVTQSSEIEKEKLSENITTERFEMQTEIATMMQEQRNLSVDTHVHQTWGTGYFDGGANFANNTSKEESNRQAITHAKETTNRAMERILSKIKTEKTVKITDRYTEVNKHGFYNAGGAGNVSGVYRNVNAIYKNQIYNYGKRTIFEFAIPQPSKLHRLGLEASKNNSIVAELSKPINPKKILAWREINSSNYIELSKKYEVEVTDFPSSSNLKTYELKEQQISSPNWVNVITLDSGVSTKRISISISYSRTDQYNAKAAWFRLYIDGVPYEYGVGSWGDKQLKTQNFDFATPKSSINIGVFTEFIAFYNVSIKVFQDIDISEGATELVTWQKAVFKQLYDAYLIQLAEYNDQFQYVKEEQKENLQTNPLFYRQIEQLVLRKNCISYLIDDSNKKSNRRFGINMYRGNSFEDCHVKQSKDLDEYASFIKFIEQAFEWNLMSYTFYPYYWGSRCDWKELYQYDCNDPLFKNFMQAGMARVFVTVKPNFEKAVAFYLETGKIWNGGKIPVIGDPLYLSLVDELKETEYEIEETWETVMPTNLIALQKDGVKIIEPNGLPCSAVCKEHSSNSLILDETKLRPQKLENEEK